MAFQHYFGTPYPQAHFHMPLICRGPRHIRTAVFSNLVVFAPAGLRSRLSQGGCHAGIAVWQISDASAAYLFSCTVSKLEIPLDPMITHNWRPQPDLRLSIIAPNRDDRQWLRVSRTNGVGGIYLCASHLYSLACLLVEYLMEQ